MIKIKIDNFLEDFQLFLRLPNFLFTTYFGLNKNQNKSTKVFLEPQISYPIIDRYLFDRNPDVTKQFRDFWSWQINMEEPGDFLSHDFIDDEFPMDATEPDDSLVQVRNKLSNFVFWDWNCIFFS